MQQQQQRHGVGPAGNRHEQMLPGFEQPPRPHRLDDPMQERRPGNPHRALFDHCHARHHPAGSALRCSRKIAFARSTSTAI